MASAMHSQSWTNRACVLLLTALMSSAGLHHAAAVEPPWGTTKRGVSALAPDHLPLGWPELKLSHSTVSASWKRVTFGEHGFPNSITVRDTELLAAPIALDMQVNGARPEFAVRERSIRAIGKGRVLCQSRLESRNCSLQITTQVDYDFLITLTLEISPREAGTLDRLVLSTSLPAALTEFCHYMDEDPPKLATGIYAERRRAFQRLDPEYTVSRGFCPIFWLGNTSAGIGWYPESARGWNTDKEAAIVFSRADGVLQFRLVTKPTPLSSSISFTLLAQPTPLRDMPRNWRTWNLGCRLIPTGRVSHQDLVRRYIMYWNSLYRVGPNANNSWVRNPETLREVVNRDHAAGFLVLPYIAPCLLTFEEFAVKDGKTYHFADSALKERVDDWAIKIYAGEQSRLGYHQRTEPPQDAVHFNNLEERNRFWAGEYVTDAKYNNAFVGPTPDWCDWMTWYVERFIHDYDADGLYVDGIAARADFRLVEGDRDRGYRDMEGNVRPTYAHLAMRDFTKRIRQVIDARKGTDGFLLGHTSGTRVTPVMSLYDIMLIGENFFYWYQEPEPRDASPSGDYYYAHIWGDIDRLKAEFFWRQWGIPNLFLPELRGRDRQIVKEPAKGTRTMLAYLLHFDMLIWPNWCATAEVVKWWQVKDKFGMADTETRFVRFVPYWENSRLTANDPAAKVSYYEKVQNPDPYVEPEDSHDLLVIVSNLQFGEAGITVGLPAELKQCQIADAGTDKPIERATPQTVKLDLDPYDFAWLRITTAGE